MSNIVRLHAPSDVDRLWDEYCALARQARANPALLEDRAHHEAMIRAHRRFASAFAALGSAA